MKRYIGECRGGIPTVWVGGEGPRLDHLDPRYDLVLHSPTGFQWGYEGSGPAQLALALLADCLGHDWRALDLYQEFKRRVVATLPRERWTMTEEDIQRALAEIGG